MKKAIAVLGVGVAAVSLTAIHSHAEDLQQQAPIVDDHKAPTVDTVAPESAEKANPNAGEKKGYVNMEGLNVRTGPKVSDEKLASLEKGTSVTILEERQGWTKIQTESGTGWVSGYYVSDEPTQTDFDKQVNTPSQSQPSNTAYTPKADKGQYQNSRVYGVGSEKEDGYDTGRYSKQSNGRIVSYTNLNIRTGPGTDNSVIAVAQKNQVVKIIGQSENGWYKVQLADGTIGWGSGSYIRQNGPIATKSATQDKDVNTNPTVVKDDANEHRGAAKNVLVGKVVNTPGLFVRSGAGKSNEVVASLTQGANVTIIGESNGWYQVKLSDGKTGWVGGTFIQKGVSTVADNNTQTKQDNTVNAVELSETVADYGNGSTAQGDRIVDFAMKFLGTPYAWGATGPDSFDCSGFTQYVYKHAVGKDIPRISRQQAAAGREVASGNYQKGDIVYFATMGGKTVSHVGIYVGGGNFIHASGTPTNPDKVRIESLGTKYWANVLMGARRY